MEANRRARDWIDASQSDDKHISERTDEDHSDNNPTFKEHQIPYDIQMSSAMIFCSDDSQGIQTRYGKIMRLQQQPQTSLLHALILLLFAR